MNYEKRYEALLLMFKEFSRSVAVRLKESEDKKAWEISGMATAQLEMLENSQSPLHQILDLRSSF